MNEMQRSQTVKGLFASSQAAKMTVKILTDGQGRDNSIYGSDHLLYLHFYTNPTVDQLTAKSADFEMLMFLLPLIILLRVALEYFRFILALSTSRHFSKYLVSISKPNK